MDSQLEELAQRVATEVVDRLEPGLVDKIASVVEQRFSVRFDEAEERLANGARVNMEALKTAIRLAAEGYGATLKAIDRRLDSLERKVDDNLRDHGLILKDHEQRISGLEQSH